MASLAARLACAYLRRRLRPLLSGERGLEAAARALDMRWPWPDGARREADPRLAGEWTRSGRPAPVATLLYLHGGAFFAGSPRGGRPIAGAFARAGFDVFAPAYRLAPAHVFPAALDDVAAAYDAIAQDAERIVLAGDSAGGGLALALALRLRARGAPLPRALALFSPWTDLAAAGASARDNEGADPIFTRRALKLAARQYLGRASARDPFASPLHAELGGLPPLLLHVGADELLLDDSRRLAERAAAAGVEVELKVWPVVPHGWQLGAAFMPEARRSLAEAAAFLAGRAAARSQ
ncbi:alpha/beta hydrolase fold domain-containing protein [Methylosinus sp. Sm6]|uniref:alpha/beta hydrolase fold domain-containing protein n=1 Tax=Methylosinus sp. Sm6 TaxID=2866948 RepID=UPI001C997786|nr:alpha/beta hydrolase fold domain-containing protein [Methylosinus sp. Sm6]MBY6241329.1 alpha/beta hydrolase [Methylosinus sp. Sm6]